MQQRPNILFLLSDQHNALTMSCAGHPVVRTPHMDRLAAEGVQFDNAYCSTPLCMPERVSLLTGRYSHNTGILHNRGRLLDEPTMPQALQQAGYRTAVTGKIHFKQRGVPGTDACDEHLHELGFDEVLSNHGKVAAARSKFADTYQTMLREKGVHEPFRLDYLSRYDGTHPHWYVRESTLDEEDYHDAYIGRLTRDWLAGYEGEEPFFCWCNWGGPHMPWDAPGRYAQMYPLESIDPPLVDPLVNAPADIRRKQEAVLAGMPPDVWDVRQAAQPMPDEAWRACRSHYYGMINVVDDGIGAMLDTLEERGLLDNTIVVYASDHGEMLLDRNLYGKQLMYEQSARVPLIVRWPERFGRGVKSEALVSSLDLIATLLDVAGAEMPVMHGESLSQLLEGSTQSHKDAVFCELGPEKMVREGPWKYVYHPEREIQQLFNLDEDPQELENLTGKDERLEQRLRERLLDWLIATETKPNSL